MVTGKYHYADERVVTYVCDRCAAHVSANSDDIARHDRFHVELDYIAYPARWIIAAPAHTAAPVTPSHPHLEGSEQ